MAPLRSLNFLLLTGVAAAGWAEPGRTCTNVTIPIRISVQQPVFPQIPAESNLEVTAFSQEYGRQGRNYPATIQEGDATVEGKYDISAQYCRPDHTSNAIQILSHGIGFDKTYWDLSYNDWAYSYTNVAIAAGYSTLAIDRLGIGNSSHGDPINEIQARLEVEALNAVTTKLRMGTMGGVGRTYSKIIHVGHSFGSIQSYWLSALYPNNTDGLVLTGWSANGSFLPSQTIAGWNLHSARLNQPLRFGDAPNDEGLQERIYRAIKGSSIVQTVYDVFSNFGFGLSTDDIWNDIATTEVDNLINGWNVTDQQRLDYPSGYLTHSDLTANQFVFLRYGAYDIGLGVVTEQTKQPVTIGELLTAGAAPAMSSFKGPVLVFTGQYDQPFCGFDCFATGGAAASIPAQAKPLFPNAAVFEAYIQPNTGHGINAHYNSTAGNEYVQSWLAANGFPV